MKYALLAFSLICSSPAYADEQNKNSKIQHKITAQPRGNSKLVKKSTDKKKKNELSPTISKVSGSGILLSGKSTDLASAHLVEYIAEGRDMKTIDGTYRSQLFATIKDGATVGQVNNALLSVGARISFVARNSPVITIQVPDPGSIAALEKISAKLVNSGAFEVAHTIQEIGPD